MDKSSGVGVVDKTAAILAALTAGPTSLAELVAATGIARPTAYRLARALETHGLVARDAGNRMTLGPRLGELASAANADRVVALAGPVLTALRDATGESAQLYQRNGQDRVCVATADLPAGLRDTVPVGSVLSMEAGSAAQILAAWDDPARVGRLLERARFSARTLSVVRRRGWAASVAERESGVASVSAPVRGPGRQVIAAISVSGPIGRLTRQPGVRLAPHVLAAAGRLTDALTRAR